jgi:hypothetical protein
MQIQIQMLPLGLGVDMERHYDGVSLTMTYMGMCRMLLSLPCGFAVADVCGMCMSDGRWTHSTHAFETPHFACMRDNFGGRARGGVDLQIIPLTRIGGVNLGD